MNQAREALEQGDKATARDILANLVTQQPQNADAWILLADALDDSQKATYCLQRAQSITSKSVLPRSSTPTVGLPLSATDGAQLYRRCPYCAEEIRVEASICKHCGRDVSILPQSLAEERAKLRQRLMQLETELVHWESYLQEQSDLAQKAGSITSRVAWILIGILLAPIGIGLVIIVLALIDIFARGAKRSRAQRNQSHARREIEIIRKRMVETKAKLTSL